MRALCLLLLCLGQLRAGWVYEFNPVSQFITNRGVRVIGSANTPDYEGKTNFLAGITFYPTGVPLEFTKASNGVVRALTAAESNLLVSLITSNNTWQIANERTNAQLAAQAMIEETNMTARAMRAGWMLTIRQMNLWRPATSNLVTTQAFWNALSNTIINDPR
jgi:hypothetical protein